MIKENALEFAMKDTIIKMEPVFSEAVQRNIRITDSEAAFLLQSLPTFVKFPPSNSIRFAFKIVEKDYMPIQETEIANLALQIAKAV